MTATTAAGMAAAATTRGTPAHVATPAAARCATTDVASTTAAGSAATDMAPVTGRGTAAVKAAGWSATLITAHGGLGAVLTAAGDIAAGWAAAAGSVPARVAGTSGATGVAVVGTAGTTVTAAIPLTRGAVASSSCAAEAMAAPAVTVAPVSPGTDAEKDAVIEVARAVEALRCTGIGGVPVITVGAGRRRAADVDADLRLGCRPDAKGKDCGCEREQSSDCTHVRSFPRCSCSRFWNGNVRVWLESLVETEWN